jgi:D-serine deaminase-like pyridoxal phosphate-dependent protein
MVMNPMQYPRHARPGLARSEPGRAAALTGTRSSLATVERGARLYFMQDVQPLVLQACRAHGISFDLFATRFNLPRSALVLVLKGHDPVTRQVQRAIEDFVLRGLSLSAGITPWQQATAATAQDRL